MITQKLANELSEKLTYHNVNHTLRVFDVCQEYIKRLSIDPHDAYLLQTAAMMHDTGYLNHYENHEEGSVQYVQDLLPGWGYSAGEIAKIIGMIRATKIPQKPETLLEKIIGDADLDYLGTDSYDKIATKLYQELINLDHLSDKQEWTQLQIEFLQKHQYHTDFARKYREPVKQKHLKEILDKKGW
ncbi:MAG TPA: HD domain-containing protein [Sunxiuqinia sp.]|nr:HD domain-containing protein [Sunxiuqinia sp.]